MDLLFHFTGHVDIIQYVHSVRDTLINWHCNLLVLYKQCIRNENNIPAAHFSLVRTAWF